VDRNAAVLGSGRRRRDLGAWDLVIALVLGAIVDDQGHALRLGFGDFGKADLRACKDGVGQLAEHGRELQAGLARLSSKRPASWQAPGRFGTNVTLPRGEPRKCVNPFALALLLGYAETAAGCVMR